MLRRSAALRAILVSCALSFSAHALDPWDAPPTSAGPGEINTIHQLDCFTAGPPGPANCSSTDWVETCGSSWGSTDPNDTSGANPCLAPIADGKGGTTNYVQMAQQSYQTSHTLPLTDSVFLPKGINVTDGQLAYHQIAAAGNPDAIAPPAVDEFLASDPSPPREVMETHYGKMHLADNDPSHATTWANQEVVAQYNAWNLQPTFFQFCTAETPGFLCQAYSRDPYREGIDAIQSCEDYVYRSFYSIERWIDGINACQGNAHCKVDLSLQGYTAHGSASAPAIFRQRPTNADGAYIYDPTDPQNHITELIAKKAIKPMEADPFDDHFQLTDVPKNAFYAGTRYVIPSSIYNSMQAAGIDAQGLLNELVRGDMLYESGQGTPTQNGGYYVDASGKLHQGFYDEWDFHHFMNQATQTTSDGEAREYARRNHEVQQKWKVLANSMVCLYVGTRLTQCQHFPDATGSVKPGDIQEYEGDMFAFDSIISQIAPQQMAEPPSLNNQVGFGRNLVPSAFATIADMQAANLVSGAQAISDSAHAPGMLAANAVTSSVLLGALNLPSQLLDTSSVAQMQAVEDIASSEARAADIFANSGILLVGGHGLGLVGGVGGLGLGGIGGLLGGSGLNGNVALVGAPLTRSIIAAVSASTPQLSGGPALRRIFPGGGGGTPPPGGNSNPGSVANYVQPWSPACGSNAECANNQGVWTMGGTSWMVDYAWTVNPPHWTTDSDGQPILNCDCFTLTETTTNPPGATDATSSNLSTNSTGNVTFTLGTTTDATANAGVNGLPNACILKSDPVNLTHQMWRPLCKLTNTILKEWNRKEAGHPSCLDHGSYACDWMPEQFVRRYVNNNMHYGAAAKEVEYNYCKRWTDGGDLDNSNTNLGIPAFASNLMDRANLVDIRAVLDARRDAFEKKMKNVPVLHSDVFGKTKSDQNGLGNDQFGGGYDYTISWRTFVRRFNTSDSTDPNFQYNGNICRLGGNASAMFDAFATLFGNQIPIINADIQVNSNDADDGTSNGWADLTIAGSSVFTFGGPPNCPDANNPNCVDGQSPISFTGSYQNSQSNSDKPQFVEAPFQVGWVTVTVKAGVLFDYGANVDFTATTPQPNTPDWCNPNPTQLAWEARGVFSPNANLGVWVDADVSLAGIFGVGIEVDLVLLGLTLPLTVDAKFATDPQTSLPAVNFTAGLDLTLTTLSGELDFYIIAFWAKVASFTIVSWSGFSSTFPIFRTPAVYLDLEQLTPGSIQPPGGVDPSADI